MNWPAIVVTLLQQAAMAAVLGGFIYFITRSTPMRNADYRGPGRYDVRLTVDNAALVLTVYALSRDEAPLIAADWARNNLRERVCLDVTAEVIRPNQD